MITFILIVIIIILILLIINQGVNNYSDTHTSIKSETCDIEPYNLQELQVKKIGICYSVTRILPYEIYSVAHEDILCLCDDNKWYILAEIYDKGDFLGKTKHIIGIREVEPKKKITGYNFIFNNYKYSCFKLYKPSCYVNLKFVYKIFTDEFNIPYHIIKNNCHHMTNRVIDIITNRRRLRNISEFEPLNYLKKSVVEIFNDTFDE